MQRIAAFHERQMNSAEPLYSCRHDLSRLQTDPGSSPDCNFYQLKASGLTDRFPILPLEVLL
jgi:hypothetical protein